MARSKKAEAENTETKSTTIKSPGTATPSDLGKDPEPVIREPKVSELPGGTVRTDY